MPVYFYKPLLVLHIYFISLKSVPIMTNKWKWLKKNKNKWKWLNEINAHKTLHRFWLHFSSRYAYE